jgi:hypothetical protein
LRLGGDQSGRRAFARISFIAEDERAMAIYRLLKFAAFDPEDISCMTTAYEDALVVLRLADRQDPITELVAKKIIEVSQQGERDPVRLREKALSELGILPEPST